MTTSIPTIMTKKGFTVQSTPPAEYVFIKNKKNEVVIARSSTPYCPRCGVSQHSHAAIGCEVSATVAQELADLL